jgi:hypothetical protein
MNRIIAGLGVLFFLTPAQVHPAHQAHSSRNTGATTFPLPSTAMSMSSRTKAHTM